jgi:hypothetical protein
LHANHIQYLGFTRLKSNHNHAYTYYFLQVGLLEVVTPILRGKNVMVSAVNPLLSRLRANTPIMHDYLRVKRTGLFLKADGDQVRSLFLICQSMRIGHIHLTNGCSRLTNMDRV